MLNYSHFPSIQPSEAYLRAVVRFLAATFLFAFLAQAAPAQQSAKATLDTSETLFSVLTAINSCGYDQELAGSDPLRTRVRTEINAMVANSREAADALRSACAFYRDHQQPDPSRDLAQYVSLALNLGEPPQFPLLAKEADLPPDAFNVLGFLGPLQQLYSAAGLHTIWTAHRAEYDALVQRMHDPVTRMVLQTDVYLRMPISGYLGRRFLIFLEPMGAPGQVNARNYQADYYIVVSPTAANDRIDEIRHTYLHFVLDPLLLKRATTLKRLEPLLDAVKTAPIDESYKNDVALLVIESLIRAIEARLVAGGKAPEPTKAKLADAAVSEGFILTRQFNDSLAQFEKGEAGFQDSLREMLLAVDPAREKKRAAEVVFVTPAKQGAEVQRTARRRAPQVLDLAEERLAEGDGASAQKLARQALEENKEDPARAMFILARAASLNKDMKGAQTYFERTLEMAREPRVLAWSHIYLGRILDLQEERDAAVQHYRAALAAGDSTPDTRAAAERGIEKPYEPQRGPAKP